MQPTDVDQIASAVASTLAGSDPGLLGCGAVSSPTQHFCPEGYSCEEGRYECGGAASFACGDTFGCFTEFFCAALLNDLFSCRLSFSCAVGAIYQVAIP